RHQDLLERFGLKSGETCRPLAQGRQKLRKSARALKPAAIVIVAPAERSHAAVSQKALEFERLQLKGRNLSDSILLFAYAQHILRVTHAFGKQSARLVFEKIGLGRGGHRSHVGTLFKLPYGHSN